MPKVSVVLPVFNGAQFIGNAIQSVLKQSFRDFEVIVVDDGSTDGTEKVVRQYSDGIRYHFQSNQGAGVARNIGVSLAQGEWIAFLDADDTWYPDKLKIQLNFAAALPEIALFYSDMDTVDDKDRVTEQAFLGKRLERRRRRKRRNLVSIIFDDRPPPYPSTVFIKKNAFIEAGAFSPLFRGNYHEDLEFFSRVAQRFPIYFIPQSLAQYRAHDSKSGRDVSNWDNNWPVLLNRLWETWQGDPQMQAQLLYYYAKYFSDKGRYLLRKGDYSGARVYFRTAYSYKPVFWRNLGRWTLSFFPVNRVIYSHFWKR